MTTSTQMNQYDLNPFLTKGADFGNEFDSLFPTTYTTLVAASISQPPLSFTDDLLSSPLGEDFLSRFLSPFDSEDSEFGTPELVSSSSSSAGEGLPSLFYSSAFNNVASTQDLPTWSPPDLSSTIGNVSPQLLSLDFSPSPPSLPSLSLEVPPLPLKSTRGRKPSPTKSLDQSNFSKDKFTGTRNTLKPAINFTAPTMSRSYIIPATTSRKRAPAAITSKLLPKVIGKRSRAASVEVETGVDVGEEGLDPSEIPEELLSAIEAKRRSNTLAARRSRMRKTAFQDELKGEIEELKRVAEEWKGRAERAELALRELRGE